ncbi:MAG: SoxR reducing system RseC family protein [Candidatus Marinimicrobia bacterium]|nr:SoxR reducing system RseC family protein [Candidatus Neomarinimicrobiota bacterium]MBL7022864.1 SoxR reducing system RseC family protein [Candidatus Neomarinimicrobiota bacterium]MBL7109183.1 SoxR reducing system RseC family protein [Candidatus Neomarinimicrobiota bacterium]
MTAETSHSGIVREINGEIANVELLVEDSCEHCSVKIICKSGGNDNHSVTALNSIDAKVGDTVVISETENLFLKFSLIQYGIPLLGFLTGMFLVFWINPQLNISQEIVMFISGLVGLSVSFFIAKYLIQKITSGKDYCFETTKIQHS